MKLFNIKKFSIKKGFTLIELLVVIAVLGILATVVLVSLDPIQQLARGRDAGRKTTVGQLEKAVEAYFTSRQGVYPADGPAWINTLVDAGEIRVVPPKVTNIGALCTTNQQNGWCYKVNGTVASKAGVWTRLDSKSESAKCVSGTNPYFTWDSVRGSTCLVCKASEPDVDGVDACNAAQ